MQSLRFQPLLVDRSKLRHMSSRAIAPGVSAGGAIITSQADVANTKVPPFSAVRSSENYDRRFRLIKENAETFAFALLDTEAYNTYREGNSHNAAA
jgi:hypothetical protein